VLSLFIIGHMGLFFYNKIGSIISIGDLPTTNIIEPINLQRDSNRALFSGFTVTIPIKNYIKIA
ncbi:hypothetical protein, partial [Streptococcus pneumoniae]|uniref:hypothetical protein n=1 Tax=Streptococcus pneumoniae TaxID=1313 RepID=UPI00067A9410